MIAFALALSMLWTFTDSTNSNESPINQNINKMYTYTLPKAGSIKPQGWIKNQLKNDLNEGYIGHFHKVHPTVTHNLFTEQNRKSKRKLSMRKEWWSGEHEGYWKDAIVRMAFLTNDSSYIEKAHQWMDTIIMNTGADGYIGIYENCEAPGCRFKHVHGNGELWTTSRIIMAMLAYYEYTADEHVLSAAEKAVQLIMDKYKELNYFAVNSRGGGVSHGIGFFENLEWLYRITENEDYLKAALKLYTDFNNGNVRDDDLQTQNLLKKDVYFQKHGAHIAEGLFVPQFIASISDDVRYQQAAKNTMEKLEYHLTPSGAMRCDEWIKGRKGTADERYEYCGITEMVSPLNTITALTGDTRIGDKIETMVFNAAQGSRFPVLKGLSYLTSDNRIKINHQEIAKRQSYDASHLAAACCVLNGARLMPYYVEGMWMKMTEKPGILAQLYGPSVFETNFDGTKVKIEEQTNYPFEDKVKFIVHTAQPVSFSFALRKPHGTETAELYAPKGSQIEENSNQWIIEHTWNNGDTINIDFNFEIKTHKQPKQKP
ncbi:MAG: glycoside hydrolase family 127 protein [Salinivirgaceae bacterium]